MPDIEVFSQVVGTLSEQMLDLIVGDKHAFLTDLLQPLDVSVSSPADLNVICIYGKLESIIQTKALLESKLPGHKEESKRNVPKGGNVPKSGNLQYTSKNTLHKDSTIHSLDVNKSILSLNIKKNLALCEGDDYELKTDNLELKTNSDVAEMIVGCSKDKEKLLEDKEEKNSLHELHADDLSKTSNKTAVKTVTRSGRKIKKPVFVKNYETLSDSDDSDVDKLADESNQTKENTFLNLNRTHSRGAKRKRGRKSWQSVRRYPNSYSRKSDGNIDPENDKFAKSAYGNEEVKNTDETVEQSPRKRSPRINLTLAKNLADKKGIKKYYEDRMPFKYFCSLCSYKAKRESHYEKHLELHKKNPGMKLFNCNECDFVTIRKGVLYRHWLTHLNLPDKHALKVKQSGGNLDEGIKDIKFLEEHQTQHKLKPVLSCKLCQFEHVLKDSSVGEGSSIDAVDGNNRIVKSKGEGNDKLYECQQCNYQTSRKLNFVRHQKGVHSNLRPHLCDLCGMAFKRSDGLKAHKESHLDRGQRNLPYPCKLCGKRFKSLAHVKEHSTVHTTTRSFQCDICGQMFKTMNVQRRHVLSVHRKTNWLSCPFCKKSFSSKYTLKRHLNSHIGESVDGLEISTDSTKNILDKISKGEGYQKVGQGQMEDMDENLSAIKTITVTTENMAELTEQLESVTGQIQSLGDIGEVYIQELSDGSTNTVNIVSIKGDELSKILIPSSVPSSQVDDTEMVSEGMKLFQYPSTNISTHITHLESVKDAELENIIPVESIKQAFCLNSLNQNSSTNDETINQDQPEADDISYETVGGDQMLDEEGQIVNMNVEHIIDEGQIIDAGQLVEFVTTDGQTYRVKWDDAQQGLCLEAQNNESQ